MAAVVSAVGFVSKWGNTVTALENFINGFVVDVLKWGQLQNTCFCLCGTQEPDIILISMNLLHLRIIQTLGK